MAKRGRPEKGLKRSSAYHLRLYPVELKALEQVSKEHNMPMSDCIRAALNMFVDKADYALSHYGSNN